MKILPIIAVVFLWPQLSWALTAAQINAKLASAKEQYTVPAGDHRIDFPIVLQEGKTLRADDGADFQVPEDADFSAFVANGISGFKLLLGKATVTHGVREFSETANDRHCLTIRGCKNFEVVGGVFRGGVHSAMITSSKYWRWRDTDCGNSLNFGAVIIDCDIFSLERINTHNHCGDGLRLLANNRNGKLFYCSANDNGGYLTPAGPGYSGYGIHLGQSRDMLLIGCSARGNTSCGIGWKSTLPPNQEYLPGIPWGRCENLTLEDCDVRDNYNNGVDVRWNYFTAGTVRPTGFICKRLRSVGHGKWNGLYLDSDKAEITKPFFQLNAVGLGAVNSKEMQPAEAVYEGNGTNRADYEVVR